MNENDFRDVCAMFAMLGLVIRNQPWHPSEAYEVADAMLEIRNKKEDEEELGIAAVKPKRTYVRKTYNR